jgi:hypothetical protein
VQTRGKPRNLETTPKVLNVIYNLNAIALIAECEKPRRLLGPRGLIGEIFNIF